METGAGEAGEPNSPAPNLKLFQTLRVDRTDLYCTFEIICENVGALPLVPSKEEANQWSPGVWVLCSSWASQELGEFMYLLCVTHSFSRQVSTELWGLGGGVISAARNRQTYKVQVQNPSGHEKSESDWRLLLHCSSSGGCLLAACLAFGKPTLKLRQKSDGGASAPPDYLLNGFTPFLFTLSEAEKNAPSCLLSTFLQFGVG